jgi:uncharacterized protein DUF3108
MPKLDRKVAVSLVFLASLAFHGGGLLTPASAESGFPYQEESLLYTVNWPGGASLGEGRLSARRDSMHDGRWEFKLSLDASIPGFVITDQFRSVAESFCSVQFEKDSVHGPRKSKEETSFDRATGIAKRSTRDGGASEIETGTCARDALAFLYFARRELSQGRVPPPGTVFFGGPYQIRMEYKGVETLPSGPADKVAATVKGAASANSFEILFARDAARTPLAFRVPFAIGTFSMELVR